MTTGRDIREARQLAGYTQAELAALVGVSMRTVGNWERGETVPQRHEARIWTVLDPKVSGDEPGATLRGYSDAALLAEIARRFDASRSQRVLEDARETSEAIRRSGRAAFIPGADRVSLEGDAQPDGITPPTGERRARQEDYDRAADDSGPSLLEQDDARAAVRGEESQDSGSDEPA